MKETLELSVSDFVIGDALLLKKEPSVVVATANFETPILGLDGFIVLSGLDIIIGSCSSDIGGIVLYRKVSEDTVLPTPISEHTGQIRCWSAHLDPQIGVSIASYKVQCFPGGNAPVLTIHSSGVSGVFAPVEKIDLHDLTVLEVPEVLFEREEVSSRSPLTFLQGIFQVLKGKLSRR